ncbi:MAG: VCBS repeat-containing protein [Oscillospiraceae bacterium]|nr:VCBS repeat-containing protein [Oscillospiraceae bacterium]
MKKYTYPLLFILVISILILAVVGKAFKPAYTLIRPPKVGGENLAIELAFEDYAGEKYSLRQPLKGDYRSAYTFIDLDNDAKDEVIVFYSDFDALDVVRMNVLDQIDGEWKSIADFDSAHNEIQQVEFADLDHDGRKEIIVGWGTYQDNMSKLISIYKLKYSTEVSIEPVYDDTYSRFEIFDIDGDGREDILNIKYVNSPGGAEYNLSFVGFTEKTIAEKAVVTLDKSFSTVNDIHTDSVDSVMRIFVDGYKVDTGMQTECFLWNKQEEAFERLQLNGNTICGMTSRTVSVSCKDIDGDGFVEVPVEENIPVSNVITSEKSAETGQSLIKWVRLKNGTAETVEYHLPNITQGYSYVFDEKWIGKITVENNLVNGILTFYRIEWQMGQMVRGEPVFAVMTREENEYDEHFSSYFKYLAVNKNKSYYYRVFEPDSFEISKAQILEHMKF